MHAEEVEGLYDLLVAVEGEAEDDAGLHVDAVLLEDLGAALEGRPVPAPAHGLEGLGIDALQPDLGGGEAGGRVEPADLLGNRLEPYLGVQCHAARVGLGEVEEAAGEVRIRVEAGVHEVELPHAGPAGGLDDLEGLLARVAAQLGIGLAVIAVAAIHGAAAHGLEVDGLVDLEFQGARQVGVGQGSEVEALGGGVALGQGLASAYVAEELAEGLLALALDQGVEGRAAIGRSGEYPHAAHDLGAAGYEAGAGAGLREALGDVEAALEVPGVEGEGDYVGRGGRYRLHDGLVRAAVGDGAVQDAPVAALEEAARFGVGGEIARGEGDVGRGGLAVRVLEGQLDEEESHASAFLSEDDSAIAG